MVAFKFTIGEKVKRLKLSLYHELITLPNQSLTDSEINIMYELSKDKDIQDILNEKDKEGYL